MAYAGLQFMKEDRLRVTWHADPSGTVHIQVGTGPIGQNVTFSGRPDELAALLVDMAAAVDAAEKSPPSEPLPLEEVGA